MVLSSCFTSRGETHHKNAHTIGAQDGFRLKKKDDIKLSKILVIRQ